jgi:hypothetical protein
MSSRARIGIVAAAVVVLVVAFVIAKGGGDDDNSSTAGTVSTPAAQAPASTTATETTGGADTQATTTTAAPPKPAVPVVTVVDAKPQGGIKKLKFTKGDTIRFRVRSDTADEIHFHGYDVHEDVKAGGTATFSVPAKIEGRFVVELEDHGTQIAEVEVDPS